MTEAVSAGGVVVGGVVVGVPAHDLDRVLALAEGRRLQVSARHDVGDGRLVLSLTGEELSAANLARQLQAVGLAAIEGPRSVGHAVAWGRRNAPVFFGPGACICFPWSVFDRDAVPLVVEIEPGRGFGAGSHPTTLLLLEWLHRTDLSGRRVLDVGCGTGVLAVAAAMQGAAEVVAVDTSEPAIAATARNVAANGVADRVHLADADLAALSQPFDAVVANIGAGVLLELAPDLRRLTGSGGELALSGLSPAQPSVLVAALAPMVLVWTDERAEWVALGFR